MLKHSLCALLALSLLSGMAHAAGDGGGGSSDSSSSSSVTIDPTTEATVAPATEPVTEPITQPTTEAAAPAPDRWTKKWGKLGKGYAAAKALVEAGKYAEAIKALKALKKPKDPRVLNYLGYSNRKLGKIDKALEYYYLAINIAPDYTRAREYLGEAFVQVNDLDKARAELAVIERLCGNQDCEEYKDLAESIEKAGGEAG